MKWHKPKPTVIGKGDFVMHTTHGRGEVLEEWGTFIACRNCFRPMPKIARDSAAHSQNGGYLGRRGGLRTTCCGDLVFAVSGHNIFDVQFADGKTYSVNGCWLKLFPVPVLAEPTNVDATGDVKPSRSEYGEAREKHDDEIQTASNGSEKEEYNADSRGGGIPLPEDYLLKLKQNGD